MLTRILFIIFCLFNTTLIGAQDILLIDKKFKEPARHADEFNANQFFNKQFPVYRSEVEVISQKADALARRLDRSDLLPLQKDTIYAGHSRLIFFNQYNGYANEITVILSTWINDMELNMFLIKQEENMRNAQLKLLGLGNYLSAQTLTARK